MSKALLLIILAILIIFVAGVWAFKLYVPAFNMISGQSAESVVSSVSQKSGLANPASVNCAKVGGSLAIMTNGVGAQYGLCNFADDQACEEWALMRGQCPVGGVKTTGFDSVDQQYCAWIGGQTLAIAGHECTLPDGQVCSTEALYNGKCPES